MAKKPSYTPEQVADALTSTNGMVFLAADKLGCCAQTVYRYAEKHKIVKDAIEHQKGKRLDVAESALWRAILDGEAWAICFYLKTQGKNRGYSEKSPQESQQEQQSDTVRYSDVERIARLAEILDAARTRRAGQPPAAEQPVPPPDANGQAAAVP